MVYFRIVTLEKNILSKTFKQSQFPIMEYKTEWIKYISFDNQRYTPCYTQLPLIYLFYHKLMWTTLECKVKQRMTSENIGPNPFIN